MALLLLPRTWPGVGLAAVCRNPVVVFQLFICIHFSTISLVFLARIKLDLLTFYPSTHVCLTVYIFTKFLLSSC